MIAPTSFFSDYGGHIRILEESIALEARDINVTIATYYKGNDVPGLDIRRTNSLPWHADYEVGSSRHKLAFDIYLLAKSIQISLVVRPHIIHAHMHEGALIGSILSRLLRVPLVFDFQGGLSSEMVDHKFLDPNGLLYPWVRRLEWYICQQPDVILTSSIQAGKMLAEQFQVEDSKIQPLPDCVDVNRFDPNRFSEVEKSALRKRLGIPDDLPIVIYLGLLADYQGIPHLIEAAGLLSQSGRKVHFLIMGYPRAAHYQALASAAGLGNCITFTGKVSYFEAPYYLSLGDIAISAKISATEGSGKVLNYMAMGQPVVAYDTPVHREYLGELGVYAPAGKVDGLVQELLDLLGNPSRRQDLGKQLRHRACSEYSWQAAAELINNIYRVLTS
jgi:glycosyltransferase involved in cell wall biosynthesis